MNQEEQTEKHYFVDEAGCGTIFNKHKEVIIGQEGCSSHFILGLLDIAKPDIVHAGLEEIRIGILSDPYFRKVPSVNGANKTRLLFHAKDDIPEVRKIVFSFLIKQDCKFQAVVRNKISYLQNVYNWNKISATYRYNPNKLYDEMTRRLFKKILHKEDTYKVYFSRRGAKDRSKALKLAIESARDKFCKEGNLNCHSRLEISCIPSFKHGGLQAVDYFLWALQRFFEKKEERYLDYIWSKCSLIHDIDDTRERQYGVYYNKTKPLTLAALVDSGI